MLSDDLDILADAVSMILEKEDLAAGPDHVKVRRKTVEFLVDRINDATAAVLELEGRLPELAQRRAAGGAQERTNVVILGRFPKPRGDAA